MALTKPTIPLKQWSLSEEGQRDLALRVRSICNEYPHYLDSARYRVYARPWKRDYRYGWSIRIGWK